MITGRLVTRQVDEIARVEILAPDGTTETLEGTPIHPILSVDLQDWIPLGELSEGEQLQAAGGVAVVLSLTLLRRSLPVYNIEVHGEHVYQVGELGLLVHNAYADTFFKTNPSLAGLVVVHHRIEQQIMTRFPGLFTRAEIDAITNLTGIPKHLNSEVHLSTIRRAWNRFCANNPTPSRDDLAHFARIIDEWILKGIALP